MVNGINLQTIQFKEPSLDRNIANKVKSLHSPYSADPILLFWQVSGLRPENENKSTKIQNRCSTLCPASSVSPPSHLPSMAVMCLGKFWGIPNGIAFALEKVTV